MWPKIKLKKKNLCTARFENSNCRPLDFPSLPLPITFLNLSLGNFFMRWQRIGKNGMNLNWVNYQGKEETKYFLPNTSLSSLLPMLMASFNFWLIISSVPIPSCCQGSPVNCYLSEVCAPTRKPVSGFSCSRKANKKQVEILNFFCATNTLAQTGEFHRSLLIICFKIHTIRYVGLPRQLIMLIYTYQHNLKHF